LLVDWSEIDGDRFLNPPFADIEPWAKKSALHRHAGRTFMLVPASVGSNWYAEHVHGIAHVVALSPRLMFIGETNPYPKDLALLIWSSVCGGFSTWRWKP
jgi:hypothetical protein